MVCRNFLLLSDPVADPVADPVRSRTVFVTKRNRRYGGISVHGGDLSHNLAVQGRDEHYLVSENAQPVSGLHKDQQREVGTFWSV